MTQEQALATVDAESTTSPQAQPDVQALLASLLMPLSRNQQRYLAALLTSGDPSEACKASGIDSATVSAWRAPSRETHLQYRQAEQAVLTNRVECSIALAQQTLKLHAAQAAERIAETATAPATSSRELIVRQRAAEYVLGAAGIGAQPQETERLDIAADNVRLRLTRSRSS